jgi:DNA-binding transcriptional LysR family regulator
VTEFGQKIRQLAQNILEKIDQIEVATDHYKGVLTGNIRIASASTGKYVIPYFLTSFMREHPGVNISIDVTNKMQVVESLQQNSVDFALVSVIPQNLNLTCIPLIANELYLVGAQDYPGLPKRMTTKSLGNYPLIFREKGSATLSAMKTFLNKNQVQVKRSMMLVSNEAVKQAVRAGLGLSIMPLIGIRSEIQLENMKLIPMKGLPITTQWNLTYSSGKQLSPACQALVDYIQEYKEVIRKEYFI